MSSLPSFIGILSYEIECYEIYEIYRGVMTRVPNKVVHCEEDVLDEVERILEKGPNYSFKVLRIEKAIIGLED